MNNETTELWIVSGRVHGDDDDTVMCIEARPDQVVQNIFEDEMAGNYPEARDDPDYDLPVYTNFCCTLAEFIKTPIRRRR